MCTCSLMPSSFSCSCSGFAPLRYGARVPSFSAGDDAAAARHARELADHRAQVERVVERGDAERDVEARRRRTGAARRRPGRAGTGRRAPRRTSRGRGRSAGRRRGRRRRTRSRAARGAATPSSSPRRSRARGRRGGRSGRAGAAKPCSVARPGAVLPAEVAVQERQRRVDPVVGLVPALLAGEHAATPRARAAWPRCPARTGRAGAGCRRPLVAASAGAAGERRGECPAAGRADDEARDLGGGAGHAAPGRGATWVPRLTRPAPAARRAPARPPASAGGGP